MTELDKAILLNNNQLINNQYTDSANFCSPGSYVIGRSAIFKKFDDYFRTGGETDQHTKTLTCVYDSFNHRGVIERIWHATPVAT